MLDLSCRDWRQRIVAGRSLLPEIPVDAAEARRAVGIYNRLHLPDVPGQPALAEAGGDWFREIVSAMFGAVRIENDQIVERLIRELLCMVPKKNSKTTNGAAFMMTALLLNRRPRAAFILVGPTQEVAQLAFDQATGMIDADPDGFLQKRFKPLPGSKEIIDLRTKATLRIKSFDASVMTGVKPSGVLLDELHEIGKSAHAAQVIGQIRGGLLPNPEAFFAMITTQSDAPPAGAFRDELKKARAVREGRLQISMLPVLYEFPEEIQAAAPPGQTPRWQDPSLWWMVSPNRGKSLTIERLIEEWNTAQAVGLAEMVRWASQHLNIEIGVGLRTDRWRGADHWETAAEPGLTLEGIIARSEVVVAGVDGGGLDDLLGLALIGRERETRRWLHWGRAWLHRKVLTTRKSEASRFESLVETGDLVLVDDMEAAFAELAGVAALPHDAGLLAGVGLDPEGIGGVVDALAAEGIEGPKMLVAVSQGFRLNGPIKTAEIKLANGTLVHCGQELMAYAVGNAKLEPKGNAVTITKAVAGTAKIDPLMALFNAAHLMSRNPQPATTVIEQGYVLL